MKKSELRKIIREEILKLDEVNVKVNMKRFNDSIESAYITVTSPTGKSVNLKKIRAINGYSPEELKVWRKLINNTDGVVDISKSEMQTVLNMSKK